MGFHDWAAAQKPMRNAKRGLKWCKEAPSLDCGTMEMYSLK